MTGDLKNFITDVKAQLALVEKRLEKAAKAVADLHEMAARGLDEFGPAAGVDGEFVALTIAPKKPGE